MSTAQDRSACRRFPGCGGIRRSGRIDSWLRQHCRRGLEWSSGRQPCRRRLRAAGCSRRHRWAACGARERQGVANGHRCSVGVAERVLTLRDLNRATLARQLLLKRRAARADGGDRASGRHAGAVAGGAARRQSGPGRRASDARRSSASSRRAAVVKATAMRQTLHLVTRRDYALLRAALSETNFPWESAQAKRLAPSVRTLAMAGQVTTEEALVHLEREHGLTGIDAAAHVLHHHETALWRARPAGRFVVTEEPGSHVPVEARAEILRRYLEAFGPASRRDIVAWSMMHVPELQARARSARAAPLPRRARPRAPRRTRADSCRTPKPPHPFASCRSGTTCCSRSRTGRACSRSRYRKTVIRMNGDVAQTFLVDGLVAGIWRVRERAGRVGAVRSAVTLGATRARGRGRTPGSVSHRVMCLAERAANHGAVDRILGHVCLRAASAEAMLMPRSRSSPSSSP